MSFAQFSNFFSTHFATKEPKRISSISLGILEIDGNFVIRESHSRVMESLFGESQLVGKSFINILKHRTSSEDFLKVQTVLNTLVTRGHLIGSAADNNPFNCLRITMRSQTGKEIIKYIRCQFQKSDHLDHVCWQIKIKDISKTVRISKLIKRSNEKAELKVNAIMSLLQFERDLVREFLENTIQSLRVISDAISDAKKKKKPASELKRSIENIFCLVHQIKGDSAIFNLKAVSNQAHDFEELLADLNIRRDLTSKDLRRLVVPLRAMIIAVKDVRDLFGQISEGGWSRNPKSSGDSMMRRLQYLVKRLENDNAKRVIIVDDGFHDSAIPMHLRQVVNTIVVQLARNAVVHGVEDEETRIKHDKTPYGCLHVSVTHNGSKCIISVRDDGRGIDIERVRKLALKTRIFDRQHVITWNKTQLLNALFKPGFSTAKAVTLHAGRGVGLDVIKSMVEKYGGTIGVRSELNQFTEFTMAFPRKPKNMG